MNTARSVGASVSSTTSIAIKTLSASSTSSATSDAVSTGAGYASAWFPASASEAAIIDAVTDGAIRLFTHSSLPPDPALHERILVG